MKKVLITGVSRGIGKATAQKFLDEGWSVLGTSTSGESVLKHPNLKTYKLDVVSPKSIEKFVGQIGELKDKIDVLVNNAGVYPDREDGTMPISILRKTLEVNLIGLADLCERLLPYINRGGHIINISSGAATITEFSGSYVPAYQISKAALNMYTRTLASRLAGKGITVSSFDPGWVKTDMGGKEAPRDPAEEIYELATSKVDSGYFWRQGKKRSW